MNTETNHTPKKLQGKLFFLSAGAMLLGIVSLTVAFPGQILSQTQYNIADINKDGIVDLTDYSILAENFFQTGQSILADINMDEIVDLTDYSILAENFFKTGPDSSPTPTTPSSNTVTFSATLAPQVTGSQGYGSGSLVLNTSNRTATVSLSFSNLTSAVTGVHIHGPSGTNQDAILFPFSNGPFQNQQITLTAAQVTDLNAGKLYFNVHTQNYGSGEIKGILQVSTSVTPTPAPTSGATPPPSGGENSHAMGLWTPNTKYDTCTKEIHDSYKVKGPDGKWYPTWHAHDHTLPNGSKCTFGHEHGRDPKSSELWTAIQNHYGYDANGNGTLDASERAVSGLPFGYVNEQLDVYNSANSINNGMRHEDHVGHKVDWENNVGLQRNACNGPSGPGCNDRINIGVTCDFLMKPHQGTHSQDAFSNNLHELLYITVCDDGTNIVASKIVAFGPPGEFTANDKRTVIKVPGFSPANAPSGNGVRFIPTADTERTNGFYEDWISSNYIRTVSGQLLAYYDPHFAVFGPSRIYDASKPNNVGRTVDLCFIPGRPQNGTCDKITDYGRITSMDYDDPRAEYNGCKRETYFNQTDITNQGGPTIWYTDPYGTKAQANSFAGSVKQYIASINNGRGFYLESQASGADRDYCEGTVHAPN